MCIEGAGASASSPSPTSRMTSKLRASGRNEGQQCHCLHMPLRSGPSELPADQPTMRQCSALMRTAPATPSCCGSEGLKLGIEMQKPQGGVEGVAHEC